MRRLIPGLLAMTLTAHAGAAVATRDVVYEGSSTVFPIIVALAEQYGEIDPRFSLEAKPTGSSAGFRTMLDRTCNLNGASRAINAKEAKAAQDARIEFIEVPVAFDALSVVVSARNHWLKDLTLAELKSIFARGGPAQWRSVRGNFPETAITAIGAGGDSGTYDYFIEAVLGKDGAFRTDYKGSEDDHRLVQGVAADTNAIAYMGLSYVMENRQMVRAVAIAPEAGKPAILPSKQTVVDGTYTPLSRPLFLYMRADQAARPDIAGFVNYILDKPELVESVGCVALPSDMRAIIKDRFAKRVTGSMFSGVAVGSSLAEVIRIEARSAGQPSASAAPAAAAAPAAVAVAIAAPAAPAWRGPNGAQYHQALERLRAAAVDLARRSLEDSSTVEDLVRRSADLHNQATALAEAFRSAPRTAPAGLSLAEAANLAK